MSSSEKPLVSMVIALYEKDDVDHFRMALESSIAQTYENIEHIVVIDGPVDEAKNNVIIEMASSCQLIVLRLSENVGPAAARNIAFKEASGQFIAIMDADDISQYDRIEKQLYYLESNQLDLISSALNVIDNDGRIIGERMLPVREKEIKSYAPYRCPLHNTAVFGKAELIKSYLYDENLRVSEDYDLWIRMLIDGRKLGNISEKLVLYRQSIGALNKRRGWRYAYSDIVVKWKARKLVMWYMRPVIVLIALLAAVIRLLPTYIFCLVYNVRNIVSDFKTGHFPPTT
jgi:glycosyltransferase involved in cell wall biosynthesis